MTDLATAQDVADFLQGTVDTAAAAIALDLAMGMIQGEARQHIFRVDDDVVSLRGGTSALILPERPVISVSQVQIDGVVVPTTAYQLRGDELYLLPGYAEWWSAAFGGLFWGYWPSTVDVTYSHGYDPDALPPELRAVCVSVAARAVSNPQGLRQERMGGYEVQYAGAGDILVPGVSLSSDEKRTIRRTLGRRRVSTLIR